MTVVKCALVNDHAPESMVKAMVAEGYTIFTITDLVNAQKQNDSKVQLAYTSSGNSITQFPYEVHGARFDSTGRLVVAISMNLTQTFGLQGVRKDITTGVETPGFRHARTSVVISPDNSLYAPLSAYAKELEALGAEFLPNNTVQLNGTRGKGLYQQVLNLSGDEYSHMLFTVEQRALTNNEVSADGFQYVISDITLYDVLVTRKTAMTAIIEESKTRFVPLRVPAAPIAPVTNLGVNRTTPVAPPAPPAPSANVFM